MLVKMMVVMVMGAGDRDTYEDDDMVQVRRRYCSLFHHPDNLIYPLHNPEYERTQHLGRYPHTIT